MSSFDWIMLALGLLVAAIGYFRGLFYQLATLIALILSIILSIYIASPLTPKLAEKEVLNEIHTYYLVRILAAVVLYLIMSVFIWYWDQRMVKTGAKSSNWNRFGGFFFGVCKAVLLIGGLLIGLSYIESGTLKQYVPFIGNSYLLEQARDRTGFPHQVIATNLKMVFKLMATPDGAERLSNYLKERGVKVEERMQDLKERRIIPLLNDVNFKKLLSEGEVFKKLDKNAPESAQPATPAK